MGPNWAYVDVDWKTGKTHGKLDCSNDAPIARPIGAHKPAITGMTGAGLWLWAGQRAA